MISRIDSDTFKLSDTTHGFTRVILVKKRREYQIDSHFLTYKYKSLPVLAVAIVELVYSAKHEETSICSLH